MKRNTKIRADGAWVKTKGDELEVSPRRLYLILAVILIGGIGILLVFAVLAGIVKALGEGDASQFLELLLMGATAIGLVFIAGFAARKAQSQQAVKFDPHTRTIHIANSETIGFDAVSGVYFQKVAKTGLGDLTGMVVQTGVVAGEKPVPLASVSNLEADKIMEDVVTLVRLYAEYTGNDLSKLDRYEDMIKHTPSTTPVIFPVK